MEAVLIMLATTFACVCCFAIGVSVRQKVDRGEEVKMPVPNPLKAVQEREARKEAQKERDKVEAILHNIDSYNGTGANQQDVPRG